MRNRSLCSTCLAQLGFTEGPGRAAIPWVAVRHGLSANGNDHIHLVASLVREDGRIADVHRDFLQWPNIREEMEKRFGLTRTRSKGAGMPGLTRGEMAKAEREGRHETPRQTLARTVRAAATGARSEADFLRRGRRAGLLIRPRWEQGARTTVVGYSVALRPEENGRRPIWYGGGKLAEDLTLDELRGRWDHPDGDQAADTLREWRPPGWRQMPTGNQLRSRRLRAQAWEQAGTVTADVRATLAGLDPADTAAWAGVAREAAGTLAALAGRVEGRHRGPLSRAADALARLAQTEHGAERARRTAELRPLAGVVRVATDAALASRGGPVAVAVLVMQLGRLVREVEHANRTAGRAVEAMHARTAAADLLDYVRHVPSTSTQAEQTPERVVATGERDVARAARAGVKDRERGHERG